MTAAAPFPRPLVYALVAASMGALLLWYGPPGTDLAAHLYQRAYFLRDGFALWNNYWYDGRYSFVTYSLTYYPLAALTGINVLATASVAVGTFAFALVVEREWGGSARWVSLVFAIAMAASLLSAAFPYTLGLAFALVTLAALQARRAVLFAASVAATFAASPLAFLLLVIVLAAALVRARRIPLRAVAPVALTAAAGASLWRLFPGNGRFPFAFDECAAAILFCAVGLVCTWRVPRARLLFNFFALYGAACLVCYIVPSDIGANIVRVRFVATPIAALALSLRRWRPLLPSLAALALALAWNVTPLASSYSRGQSDPSAQPTFWSPAIRFLHGHLGPAYRVEAVDTVGHWEADYLPAAGIPLVRGWFRQDDFPENAVLYGRLTASGYLAWLHRMAVRYVVLARAPTDYSSENEAALIESGRSGLPVAFDSPTVTIYAVPGPRAIVTGPRDPRVLALRSTSIVLDLHRPGTYHVALRYTPYWSAPGVCVTQTADGLIALRSTHAGIVQLGFDVDASTAFAALTGTRTSCTSSGPRARRTTVGH